MPRYCLLLLVLLVACDRPEEMDPDQLVGRWTGGGAHYTFEDNGNYQIRYLFTGYGADTLLNDSIWGHYQLHTTRHNVTLYPLGYRTRGGLVVPVPLKQQVWHLTFPTDTTLRYESRTTLGFLKRR